MSEGYPEGEVVAQMSRRTMDHPGPVDVLLLSAGYGAGHNQAAAAVSDGLSELAPDCRAHTIDYLALFPPAMRRATVSAYQLMSKHAPLAYGAVYDITSWLARYQAWRRIEYRIGRSQLRRLLRQVRPKAVVCTHPLPMGVLSVLKAEGEPVPPVIAVVTDYVVHEEWFRPQLDRYCVATKDVAAEFLRRGFDPARVRVTGIPIREPFWRSPSRQAARARLGWPQETPVVLFLTSALGTMGGATAACRALLGIAHPFRLVVVCGHDRKLYRRLSALAALSGDGRLEVQGYATNMADLLAGADVVITKAGGLTISESMALGRPLVIYRPVPGQEAGNTRWLLSRRAALVARSARQLADVVAPLVAPGPSRDRLTQGGQPFGQPTAALKVAQEVLDCIRPAVPLNRPREEVD